MYFTYLTSQQVYYTLTGQDIYDDAFHKNNPFEFKLLNNCSNIPDGEQLDISKAKKISEISGDLKLDKDKTVVNRDRFERSSDKLVLADYAGVPSESKNYDFFEKEEVKSLIESKRDQDLFFYISGPSKEKIAEYYGNMAKRLDEAYSEGKFTKEEHEMLNEGILERMEDATVWSERSTANHEAMIATGNDRKFAWQRQFMTSKQYMEEMDRRTEKFLNSGKYNIDRSALMTLFNNVRFGK